VYWWDENKSTKIYWITFEIHATSGTNIIF